MSRAAAPGPYGACLEALAHARDEIRDIDAMSGNLYQLLDGLPPLEELVSEREPEDLERIARQADMLRRHTHALLVALDEQIAKLTSPPASA